MSKHDHWKTTDVDGEDAVYRAERINQAFCDRFDKAGHSFLLESLGEFLDAADLYELLCAEFDKLTPDQQESFLGMDND